MMNRRRNRFWLAMPALFLTVAAYAGDEAPPAGEDGDFPADALSAPSSRPALDLVQAGFLRERAEAGDPAMQCLYGLSLLNGSAGRTDPVEARRWLGEAAAAGDDRARFEYGKALYLGIGGDRDQAESLRWLRPAAEKGMTEAAYYVGAALLTGEGVDLDSEEGERWLRQAAESGIGAAQADLGIAYYSGLGGVARDYGEARRWFILAAKQGNGDSANKLGIIYRNGLGVFPDPERAILWFSLGANLGDMYAQYNLACSYMNGEWVARNYTLAARWHEQSALRGNAESQYFLGCLYAEGMGVPRDPGRAREWLTQADRGGQPEAGALLETLYEIDDDQPLPAKTPLPPARVSAGALLREFARTPLPGVDRGRVVIMAVEDDVTVSESEKPGSFFLTVNGSPGVIALEMKPDEAASPGPGTFVRATGTGPSGLPGFIRMQAAEIVPAADGDGEPAADSGTANAGADE